MSDTCISKERLELISEILHSSTYSKIVSLTLHQDQKLSGNQTLPFFDETFAARLSSQQSMHDNTATTLVSNSCKSKKGAHGKKSSSLLVTSPSTVTTRKRKRVENKLESCQDTAQPLKRKRGPTKKKATHAEYKREGKKPAEIVTAQHSSKRKAVHETPKGALKSAIVSIFQRTC